MSWTWLTWNISSLGESKKCSSLSKWTKQLQKLVHRPCHEVTIFHNHRTTNLAANTALWRGARLATLQEDRFPFPPFWVTLRTNYPLPPVSLYVHLALCSKKWWQMHLLSRWEPPVPGLCRLRQSLGSGFTGNGTHDLLYTLTMSLRSCPPKWPAREMPSRSSPRHPDQCACNERSLNHKTQWKAVIGNINKASELIHVSALARMLEFKVVFLKVWSALHQGAHRTGWMLWWK